MNEKIKDAFDGAKWVKVMDWCAFIWQGGHGIHVYSLPDLKEVDILNVGDFSRNEATLEEVQDGIEDYIKDNDIF